MAKGGNPAAAERKRLEKKQQAKNKEQKAKAQELATVKKDTRSIESEIKELQQKANKGNISKAEREELDSLRAELDRIKATKDSYLEQHPEHRKFVYRDDETKKDVDDEKKGPSNGTAANQLLGRNGLPKHPERSVYYDPVFNPTGAPPPGMPYMEKPPSEWPGGSNQVAEEEDEEEEDDDDILMPEGPRPEDDSDSADSGLEDIVMPEGPPPPRPPTAPKAMLHQPSQTLPRPPPQPAIGVFRPPPPPPGGYSGPPPGFGPTHIPPPGYGLPGVYTGPPPPMHPMQGFRPPSHGVGWQRNQIGPIPVNATVITASATGPVGSSSATISAPPTTSGATISAAPQLRDLKREASELVPKAVRKKRIADKTRAAMGLPNTANVSSAPVDDESKS